MEKIKNPWQKIIFGARPVDEEDDQLDDYCSNSSDETNQEIDQFDFSNCDTSERSKGQAFAAKTCGCALGENGDHAALL